MQKEIDNIIDRILWDYDYFFADSEGAIKLKIKYKQILQDLVEKAFRDGWERGVKTEREYELDTPEETRYQQYLDWSNYAKKD